MAERLFVGKQSMVFALCVVFVASFGSAQTLSEWHEAVDDFESRTMNLLIDLDTLGGIMAFATSLPANEISFGPEDFSERMNVELLDLAKLGVDLAETGRTMISRTRDAYRDAPSQANWAAYRRVSVSMSLLYGGAELLNLVNGGTTLELFALRKEIWGLWSELRDVWYSW